MTARTRLAGRQREADVSRMQDAMWGQLYPDQEAVVRQHVRGKAVHDLGAGSCFLSMKLAVLGAERVIAVDPYSPPWVVAHPQVELVRAYFAHYTAPIQTAFVSWPESHEVSQLEKLVARAELVLYLGCNLDGTGCGSRALWEHFGTRELIAHVPGRWNTLLVYSAAPRTVPLVPEELGARSSTRLRYDDVYAGRFSTEARTTGDDAPEGA